ncbi:hypothetical protein [Sphingomonas sp. SUN039]|uniref:hypothetical protein n=1 Tax=Sphingomonas sp. SUN039 TaxID=2937787 RepID=UPI002164EBAC|nr:hypothetical protein [Sphingomonas sp. SUN039]UVO53166.1 hypothetical protein M0209_03145 [Sphingomonas sp. SUN039]
MTLFAAPAAFTPSSFAPSFFFAPLRETLSPCRNEASAAMERRCFTQRREEEREGAKKDSGLRRLEVVCAR